MDHKVKLYLKSVLIVFYSILYEKQEDIFDYQNLLVILNNKFSLLSLFLEVALFLLVPYNFI